MKKFYVYALALTLFLGNLSDSYAATPVSIDDKCSSEKSISRTENLPLICTKLNGKLTWQISTKQNQINIWNDLQDIRSQKGEVVTALDVRFSPTVNKSFAESILNGVNQAARLWQEQFLPSQPLPTLFFTEKDRNWFISQLKSMGVYSKDKVAQFDDEVRRNKDQANWAGISGQNGVTWMSYMIGTSKTKPNSNDLEVAAHEYTHLAQRAIAQNSQDQLTCWQIEGGAYFYGIYLGAKTSKQVKQLIRERNTDRFVLGFSGLTRQSSGSFEKLLDKFGTNYDGSKCGPDGAYPVGSAAMEYLYLLKGHAGTIELLEKVSSEGDFATAVQLTYGEDWSVIRRETAKYIKLVVAQNDY